MPTGQTDKELKEAHVPHRRIGRIYYFSHQNLRDLFLLHDWTPVYTLEVFSAWSKNKKRLDKISSVTGWTLHDLRRSFRTGLGALSVLPHIAERLVNHVSAKSEMEETYDLGLILPEMREAMNRWEEKLQKIFAGEASCRLCPA